MRGKEGTIPPNADGKCPLLPVPPFRQRHVARRVGARPREDLVRVPVRRGGEGVAIGVRVCVRGGVGVGVGLGGALGVDGEGGGHGGVKAWRGRGYGGVEVVRQG